MRSPQSINRDAFRLIDDLQERMDALIASRPSPRVLAHCDRAGAVAARSLTRAMQLVGHFVELVDAELAPPRTPRPSRPPNVVSFRPPKRRGRS